MSEASANRTSIRLGSFGRVSARRELLLHDITLRRKAAGELPLLLGRQIDWSSPLIRCLLARKTLDRPVLRRSPSSVVPNPRTSTCGPPNLVATRLHGYFAVIGGAAGSHGGACRLIRRAAENAAECRRV
jgi:hypothetical protein